MLIYLTIKRNLKNINITGFSLIITRDSGSEVFEVIEGEETTDVIMDDGFDTQILQVPNQGESKLYIITTSNTNIKHLQISPTINNNKCSPTKEIEINSCS